MNMRAQDRVQGFRPQAVGAGAQGFVPMAGLGTGAVGFSRRLPQDMARLAPAPVMQPAAPEPAEPAAPAPDYCPSPPPPSARLPEPVSEAALRAAQAEGHARGRAEAEAEFAAARDAVDAAAATLSALVDQITRATEAETEALAHTLDEAVRRLASERAGEQIDAAPAGFSARITALAGRIAEGLSGLSITLNPQDLAALQAAGSAETPQIVRLLQADLRADPALMRGDIRLRAAGLALDDLIHAGAMA